MDCNLNLISREECEEVLKEYLQSSNFELKSFKISPFYKSLEGLIGEHFTLQIDFKRDPASSDESHIFFLKTLTNNKVMFELTKTIDVFGKEKFFYTYLIKEFRKYGIDTSFTPEAYLFVPYKVVLEDLTLSGYIGTKKREPLDLSHCKICLETIAKFHAAAIIYEKKKSNESGKKYSLFAAYPHYLEDKFMSSADNGATKYLRSSINGLFELIDIIPENHISRAQFKARLSEVLEELVNSELPQNLISTVLHGDLWSTNLLYIYERDRPTIAKLVDYQTIKYGPPQIDVVQFIMTNTRKKFRDEHFDILIEHYYMNLCNLLTNAGLNCAELFLRGDFFAGCELFKVAGKIHAIVDRSLTFMPDATYEAALKSEDSFKKFLFEARGKYIIECFNNDQEFKSVLLEDALELRDLLFTDRP